MCPFTFRRHPFFLSWSDIDAAIWVRPAAASLSHKDVNNASARLEVDDELAELIRLIHGGDVEIGVEVSMSIVGADVSVNSLTIFDFYLRRDFLMSLS